MLVTGVDCLPSDPRPPIEHLLSVIRAALCGGVNMVQIRERSVAEAELALLVHKARSALGGRAALVVNGDLAEVAPDVGIHLPERRNAPEKAVFFGRSVHSVESARRAEQEGASYLVAGPIYKTPSHAEQAGKGTEWLGHLCAEVSIPVLAIGGIKPERCADCLNAGSSGVAVRSTILGSATPEEMAKEYSAALGAGR